MTEEGPCDTTVFQLRHTNLARKSTVGLVIDVLGGDFNALAEVLAGQEKVERWWGDHNLCMRDAALACAYIL